MLQIAVDEVDKWCPMIRMGVSGWIFLLVPAYPGRHGQRAVKRVCLCMRKTTIQATCYSLKFSPTVHSTTTHVILATSSIHSCWCYRCHCKNVQNDVRTTTTSSTPIQRPFFHDNLVRQIHCRNPLRIFLWGIEDWFNDNPKYGKISDDKLLWQQSRPSNVTISLQSISQQHNTTILTDVVCYLLSSCNTSFGSQSKSTCIRLFCVPISMAGCTGAFDFSGKCRFYNTTLPHTKLLLPFNRTDYWTEQSALQTEHVDNNESL